MDAVVRHCRVVPGDPRLPEGVLGAHAYCGGGAVHKHHPPVTESVQWLNHPPQTLAGVWGGCFTSSTRPPVQGRQPQLGPMACHPAGGWSYSPGGAVRPVGGSNRRGCALPAANPR